MPEVIHAKTMDVMFLTNEIHNALIMLAREVGILKHDGGYSLIDAEYRSGGETLDNDLTMITLKFRANVKEPTPTQDNDNDNDFMVCEKCGSNSFKVKGGSTGGYGPDSPQVDFIIYKCTNCGHEEKEEHPLPY